jgi:hypothetical protein
MSEQKSTPEGQKLLRAMKEANQGNEPSLRGGETNTNVSNKHVIARLIHITSEPSV